MGQENIQVFIEDCRKEGLQTIKVIKNGRSLYLHSRYDPLAEANRMVSELNILDRQMIVVYGVGLGYHLDQLIEKTDGKNKIVAIEPSKAVFEKTRPILEEKYKNKSNFLLLQSDNKNEIYDFLNNKIEISAFIHLKQYVLPIYTELFVDEYKLFLEILKVTSREKQINFNTMQYLSTSTLRTGVINLPFLTQSVVVEKFFNQFKDIPAIIVSGGPSLDKNIHLLKGMEDKAFIIATDRVVGKLLRMGITPHLVATIDAKESTYSKVKDSGYEDVPLLYIHLACTQLIKENRSKKAVCVIWDDFLDSILAKLKITVNSMDVGGSVSCFAFQFAMQAGFSPVVLIGQDLAYTDFAFHASDTAKVVYSENSFTKDKVLNEKIKTIDIYGDEIYTDYNFDLYRQWFEQQVAIYQGDSIFLNATEGGLNIEGIENVKLSDTLAQYCVDTQVHKDILMEIFDQQPMLNSEQYELIMQEYRDSLEALLKLKPVMKEASENSQKLLKLYQRDIYPKQKDIDRINKRLDKADQSMKTVIKRFEIAAACLRPTLIYINSADDDTNLDEREKSLLIAHKSQLLYNSIYQAIETTETVLHEALEDSVSL